MGFVNNKDYVIENNITPDKKMQEKCKHSSAGERAAVDAERAGNK
jgi:ribonuclease R